jgi:hypothetical protein
MGRPSIFNASSGSRLPVSNAWMTKARANSGISRNNVVTTCDDTIVESRTGCWGNLQLTQIGVDGAADFIGLLEGSTSDAKTMVDGTTAATYVANMLGDLQTISGEKSATTTQEKLVVILLFILSAMRTSGDSLTKSQELALTAALETLA